MATATAPRVYNVVACGRRKAPGPCKAREMYIGRPTQRWLAEAEAQAPTLILSALHGLVDPDDVIVRAYDRKLDDLTVDERRAWGRKVLRQMRTRRIARLHYVGTSPTYGRAVNWLNANAHRAQEA